MRQNKIVVTRTYTALNYIFWGLNLITTDKSHSKHTKLKGNKNRLIEIQMHEIS